MTGSLLPIAEARRIVLEVAGTRRATETVPVGHALDRVLAADVVAAADVPGFTASAMDGYAIRDLELGADLEVVGESRAGGPFAGRLEPGQAVRISTGAVAPAQSEAVIRQEDVTVAGSRVHLHAAPRPGQNLRMPGEDMRAGELILAAGRRLRAPELGAAVAAGAGALPVAVRPPVSILCTGDELRPPGVELGDGQIHNSNDPVLRALVSHCGGLPAGDPASEAPLLDDRQATEAALEAALERSEVVVVSGGVSVGPHDHVKPALAGLGVTEHFWRVALQPGKPTWFGSRGSTLVFALPGNPVSVAVTFCLFVRPALEALLGAQPERPPVPEARLAEAVKRNAERDQALRMSLEFQGGLATVRPAGAQGSHVFTSLLRGDCLGIVPRGEGFLAAGELIKLEPLPA